MNFDGRNYDALRRADEHEAEVERLESDLCDELPTQAEVWLSDFLDQIISVAADQVGLDDCDISSFHFRALEAVAAEATKRLAAMSSGKTRDAA